MLRHAIAVVVLVVLFVAALMYCITPDQVEAMVSFAGNRARQVFSPGKKPAAGVAVPRPRSRSLSELHTGADPFRP